ncbi:uncharacterized protein [Amphiura filiformis]|uniref:uncharacterized protein n=1 Tax=Amphiura filiformis TaxID=82378 RepID=UPI003B21EFA0
MGGASSKQGRYVVNPDPRDGNPVNYDPNTPSKAKRYRVISSPAEIQRDHNGMKTPEIAASVRYHTYPEGCSTHNEEYYTPSHSPEPSHSSDMSSHDSRYSHGSTRGHLDSKYYSHSKVASPSAETLTCSAPLSRREELHDGHASGDVCIVERDVSSSDGDHVSVRGHAHGSHVTLHNKSHGPHMDNSIHMDNSHDRQTSANNHVHMGSGMREHYNLNSDQKNNNTQSNTEQVIGNNANEHRLYASINHHPTRPVQYMSDPTNRRGHYMSINNQPNKPHPMVGGSVVHQQEDGRTVTHFLPYTASTPGFESTSLFIPYITSTPNKQFQMVLQTPPQPPTPPPATSNTDGDQHQHQQLPGSFTILDALFLIGSMVMYVADIALDVLVAVQYYQTNNILWSGLTMAFIIIPSLTLQYFSLRWHFADTLDAIQKNKGRENGRNQMKVTLCTILTWLVTHILQLGAINRYWRTLKFGWRSRSGATRSVRDYNQMVCEYRDTTMLRLLEAFMESAPQLVLQLYIMTQLTDIYWLTAASALASLVSLSWSLEAYHKALRESVPSEKNVGWCSLMMRMAAHTFLITSRVISLALFAAYFQWWVFVAAGSHWLLMTLWLICQKTQFCSTRCEEVMFDAVIGVVYIFSFFNMKPNRTRYRALGYYSLVFVENTVMFALWYKTIGKDTMYGLPALVLVWGGFFLGITVLLLYYRCCHPEAPLPLCDCYCVNKDSTDEAVKNQCRVEIDGPVASHPGKDNNKKYEGNLFSRSGRRHLYWADPSMYPLNKPDVILHTQPLYGSAADAKGGVNKPTGSPVFLETSLL